MVGVMATAQILETEDLLRITQLTKPADVERVLTQQGIKVFRGRKGCIWTTLDLINKAGGIRSPGETADAYDPEDLIG
jgi:hypothetical protein